MHIYSIVYVLVYTYIVFVRSCESMQHDHTISPKMRKPEERRDSSVHYRFSFGYIYIYMYFPHIYICIQSPTSTPHSSAPHSFGLSIPSRRNHMHHAYHRTNNILLYSYTYIHTHESGSRTDT